MEWVYTRGEQKPDRQPPPIQLRDGTTFTPPLQHAPRPRDKYLTTCDGRSWVDVESQLVGFWTKVCEVWPIHLAGPEADAAWDRIVCYMDVVNGYVSALAALGDRPRDPTARWTELPRTLIVVAEVPYATALVDALSHPDEDSTAWCANTVEVKTAFVNSMVGAATNATATAALTALRRWHPFAVYVMQKGSSKSSMQFIDV